MLEDTPDELVLDLIGETMFPGQALGRPIIGTPDVIGRAGDATTSAAHHADVLRAPATSSWPRRARSTTGASSSWSSEWPMPAGRAAQPRREPASAGGGRARVPGARHRAVPRLPGGARPHAARRAAVRARAARPDARQRCVVAPVPGDPRAPRHGLRRLLVRLALRRLGRRRRLPRHARRERRGVPRGGRAARSAQLAAGRFDEDELERAKDSMNGRLALAMESTRRAHEPPRQGARHRRRAAGRDEVSERIERRHGGRHRGPGGRALRPGQPLRRGHRARPRGLRRRGRRPGGAGLTP